MPVNVHEQQFHKYSSNQPEAVRVTRIEGNGPPPVNYEQQFHKYSTMHQPIEGLGSNNATGYRNTTTSVITSNNNNALNYNSQGYKVSPKPWEVPGPAPTTTTSQFAPPRPYSSIQGSTQVVSSISGPSSGEGSDFLKKIDQQLEASRKQFPSS